MYWHVIISCEVDSTFIVYDCMSDNSYSSWRVEPGKPVGQCPWLAAYTKCRAAGASGAASTGRPCHNSMIVLHTDPTMQHTQQQDSPVVVELLQEHTAGAAVANYYQHMLLVCRQLQAAATAVAEPARNSLGSPDQLLSSCRWIDDVRQRADSMLQQLWHICGMCRCLCDASAWQLLHWCTE